MDAKKYGKLAKVIRRGYVRVVEVTSLNHSLLLPKGEEIRMVYNGTYSDMNTSLWAPHFYLPMVGSTLCDV